MVELRHLGGAVARLPAVPSATGNRDTAFTLATIAPPDGVSASVLSVLEPWSNGRTYINFLNGPGAEKETARARRNYATAQAALDTAGRQAVAAVIVMAERHALPPVEDWPAAQRGADALAAHFWLEERDLFEELG